MALSVSAYPLPAVRVDGQGRDPESICAAALRHRCLSSTLFISAGGLHTQTPIHTQTHRDAHNNSDTAKHMNEYNCLFHSSTPPPATTVSKTEIGWGLGLSCHVGAASLHLGHGIMLPWAGLAGVCIVDVV